MSFNDKVVLVTGASSGIGAAVAIKFAVEGAKVIVVALKKDENKLKDVAEKCEKLGSKPLVITADVSNDEDAKRIILQTIDSFGKLDVLVNNAGILKYSSIFSKDCVPVFDQIMSVNLRAAVVLTNLAVPHLVGTKGNIVYISSIASSKPAMPNISIYCTSKAGLDHFARCVALELAPKGVRVNTVNPGPVKTGIFDNTGISKEQADKIWEELSSNTALGKVCDPEEIADLVAFLASDKARSITGSSYVNDNGNLLK